MCDFDDDEYMDEDSSEDEFNEFMDDPDDTDDGLSGEEQESNDLSTGDAFIIGGAMGWAYEEGLDERHRRRMMRTKRTERDLP